MTIRPIAPAAAVRAVAAPAPAEAAPAPAPVSPPDSVRGDVKIKQRFWSFLRPTYDVSVDGQPVGTIRRKLFSWTPTWTMTGPSGEALGSVSQRFFALGFDTDVKDAEGALIGQVKQSILRSLINPSAVLRISDARGRLVAQTDPVFLTFRGRVNLKDAQGKPVGSYANQLLALTDTKNLTLDVPLDRRLVLGFIASQIEVKRQEEARRRAEEEARRRAEEARRRAGEAQAQPG